MIDEVYQLVSFISDKNGRGYVPPAKFNLVAKMCQLEFLSSRLGNLKAIGPSGVTPFGHKSHRRVDIDINPFLYGPITVPIDNQGRFSYPYGYMWPDAWHKNDFSEIKAIDTDQYPFLKKSTLTPPTEEYPVIMFTSPYGIVDPYSIQSFQLRFFKLPPDPVWGYDEVGEDLVYNESKSVDFTLRQISLMDITALILEKIGVFLDKDQLTQYAQAKQIQGT